MATKTETKQKGYKGHIDGSRKGEVHRLFDTKGPEAAMAYGKKVDLKETTLRSWFGAWKRADGAEKVKAKPEPKAKPKKKDGKPKGAAVTKAKDADGRQTVAAVNDRQEVQS